MENRLFKLSGIIATALVVVPIAVVSGRAWAGHGLSQSKNAFNTKPAGKLTPWEAMQIAAKATGGKAFQAQYEFDDGHWIYGVAVVKNKKLMEVELDPTTGKVGETEAITPEGEAKEVTSDLKKAVANAGK